MVYMNIEWLNIKLEKEDYGDKEKRKKHLMAYTFKSVREQTSVKENQKYSNSG